MFDDSGGKACIRHIPQIHVLACFKITHNFFFITSKQVITINYNEDSRELPAGISP